MKKSTLDRSYSWTATLPIAIGVISIAHASPASAATIWRLGTVDNSQAEFGIEQDGPTPTPGSPSSKDDDYYFAGTYPDPIGVVAVDEPSSDFERGLTRPEPRVRIHFNLDPSNVAPDTQFRLVVDICCSNHGDGIPPGEGPITFIGKFNGVEIQSSTTSGIDSVPENFTSDLFTAAEVTAITGENIVTIERAATGGGAWIQFDHIALETVPIPEPSTPLLLCAVVLAVTCRRPRRGHE